jgi:hypothetical protein
MVVVEVIIIGKILRLAANKIACDGNMPLSRFLLAAEIITIELLIEIPVRAITPYRVYKLTACPEIAVA